MLSKISCCAVIISSFRVWKEDINRFQLYMLPYQFWICNFILVIMYFPFFLVTISSFMTTCGPIFKEINHLIFLIMTLIYATYICNNPKIN